MSEQVGRPVPAPASTSNPPSNNNGQPSSGRRARSRTRGRRSNTPTGNSRSGYGNNPPSPIDTTLSPQTVPTTPTPNYVASTDNKASRGVSPMVIKGLRKLRDMASRSQSPHKAAARQEARSNTGTSSNSASASGASEIKSVRSGSARRTVRGGGGGGGGAGSGEIGSSNPTTPGRRPMLARLADEKATPRAPRPRKGPTFFPAGPPTGQNEDNKQEDSKPVSRKNVNSPVQNEGDNNQEDRKPTSKKTINSPSPLSPSTPTNTSLKPVSGRNLPLSPEDEPKTPLKRHHSSSKHQKHRQQQQPKQHPQQQQPQQQRSGGDGGGSSGVGGGKARPADSPKRMPSPQDTQKVSDSDEAKRELDSPVKQLRQRSRQHRVRRSRSGFDSPKPMPFRPRDKEDNDDEEETAGVIEEPVLQPSHVSSHQRTYIDSDRRQTKRSNDVQQKPQKPQSLPEVTRISSVVSELTDASSVHSSPAGIGRTTSQRQDDDDDDDEDTRLAPIERSNLDRKALDSMKEIKDAIKQMRHHRRKVKFGDIKENPMMDSSGSISASAQLQQQQQQKDITATPKTRLEGITVNDLEVGFVKRRPSSPTSLQHPPVPFAAVPAVAGSPPMSPSTPTASNIADDKIFASKQRQQEEQAHSSPINPAVEREIKVASLQKQVKKVKKSIKRTCRDVWTEREDIIQLQRKNWSLRKTLVNSEAPRDSVTTLNLKIEKLLRQERELDMELDRCEEEKEYLEEDCSRLARSITEFKHLLDELNQSVVPLLPPLGQHVDEEEDEDNHDDDGGNHHGNEKSEAPEEEELEDESIESMEDDNLNGMKEIAMP